MHRSHATRRVKKMAEDSGIILAWVSGKEMGTEAGAQLIWVIVSL
jgi:hypothetical protein